MPKLREVTINFANGEAPVETLREAARRELIQRPLADEILRLISEWESSAWRDSKWARNDLRDAAKALIPVAPEKTKSAKDFTRAMYGAGLRGYRPN